MRQQGDGAFAQPPLVRPAHPQGNPLSAFVQPSFAAGRRWNFRIGNDCQRLGMINPPVDNRVNDFCPQAGMQPRFQGPGQFRNTFQACAPLQGAPRAFPNGQATNRPEVLCYKCRGRGHISHQCPTTQDPSQTRFTCFRCGGGRHAISVCPTPPTNPPRVQKEVPRNENPNYQRPVWRHHCKTSDHIIRNCPKLEEAVAEQEKRQCRMLVL